MELGERQLPMALLLVTTSLCHVKAIMESNNGKQFWLLLYEKTKHVVTKTFTNAYTNTYYEGDEVIRECYYDLL